ncbi:MAG: pyridoxal-phosphate dependent enzyme [Planctomycetes bacterium]|nr:pyridoxal-phosphate dependent enzyme [Planctomycetota bacterium]MBI3845731.1 pyridoxal-phosphate dependent enzyme [Planctomycetota bacterium]
MSEASSRARTAALLERFPRETLAVRPTPLERLRNLEAHLSVAPLWVKRDDLTGLAFGGNKARKLEFLMAEAKRRRALCVVTTGFPQSNHARDVAVAARRLGLDPVLIIVGKDPRDATGNLLLDQLLGAEIHFAPTVRRAIAGALRVVSSKRLRGKRPYFILPGGSMPVGALGYVDAFLEMHAQFEAMGREMPARQYVALGSGGTLAGLLVGRALTSAHTRLVGVRVVEKRLLRDAAVLRLATRTARLLGRADLRISSSDFDVEDDFVGERYGTSTEEGDLATDAFARREGIFLDPVYTAKSGAAFLEHAESSAFDPRTGALFWHTGGTIALFR